MNTFSIERGDNVVHNVFFVNNEYEMSHVANMNFAELVSYDELSDVVDAMLDATDDIFGPGPEDVFITLVDEDGYFIWSIIIEQDDSNFKYHIADWKMPGKNFCYGKEVYYD